MERAGSGDGRVVVVDDLVAGVTGRLLVEGIGTAR